MKRIISLALCLVMAASMMPVGAFAQDTGWKDCHPAHDDSCGYAEAVEGSPCTHEHTASCYVNNCTHDHVADCYSDGILPGEGEDKTADVCLHACSQESGCVTLSCPHDQGIHDGSCGYAAAVAGSACNHSCELCDPGCVCETKCAEGTPNPDCPVCGAAGADLSECTGKEPEPVTETQKTPQAQVQPVLPAQNQIPAPLNGIDEAVQNVQNQIDALPSVEELEAMSLEKQQAVYEQVRAANDAYEKLTEEGQAQIGKTKIDALFEYFSGLTAPTVSMTQRTADSIAVSASGSGQVELQYAYAEGADGTAPTEDSAWGTTNTFTGLKAGTAYTVFARYAGNDCYNASPAGSTTVYTLPEINTAALPEGTVGVAYTGATLTAYVSTGTEVTWSAEGLPKGLSLDSGTGAISGTPTEAGDHTVTVKAAINGNASNTKNLTLNVNMGTADIQITSGSGTYSYGDTITISGTIAASPTASGSNSLTPPAQNQAALFLGTDQLTQAVNVEADGSFTLSYSTGEKEIALGANTLTVKYGGSGNLNAGSEDVSITLKAKAVTAQVVVNPITKVYDGNTKATVTLGFQAGDILAGDEITVTAPDAAYASPDAGTRDIVLGSLVIAGKDQNWYAVAAPAGVTGTITQAQITGKVTISGRAALGQILTAVYSGSDPVAYQWLRNGVEIAGATGSSYTLELADVGQQIRAVVAAKDDNYKGSITSATVSVEKLPQEAPETAPKLSRRNRTTIILRAVGSSPDTNAKAEYGISYDGGQTWHWQESRRFEGLKANTTYTFALRYQATDTYEASPRSETVKITTTNTAETNPWTGDQIATAVLVMVLALAGLAVLTAREIIKRKKK